MTNHDAIVSAIGVTGFSEIAVQKALIDGELIPTSSYDILNRKEIDLAAIEVLKGMLSIDTITEGGYTIKYSLTGVQKRLDYLTALYGINTLRPTVRTRSIW